MFRFCPPLLPDLPWGPETALVEFAICAFIVANDAVAHFRAATPKATVNLTMSVANHRKGRWVNPDKFVGKKFVIAKTGRKSKAKKLFFLGTRKLKF
jgi:hypothetical protein